jgi:hypothetical protein
MVMVKVMVRVRVRVRVKVKVRIKVRVMVMVKVRVRVKVMVKVRVKVRVRVKVMVRVMVRVSMKLINRNEIIAKRQALIRAGMKPAFTFNSNHRIKERLNLSVPANMVSTTHRSPLVSRVYFSVFCKGP